MKAILFLLLVLVSCIAIEIFLESKGIKLDTFAIYLLMRFMLVFWLLIIAQILKLFE